MPWRRATITPVAPAASLAPLRRVVAAGAHSELCFRGTCPAARALQACRTARAGMARCGRARAPRVCHARSGSAAPRAKAARGGRAASGRRGAGATGREAGADARRAGRCVVQIRVGRMRAWAGAACSRRGPATRSGVTFAPVRPRRTRRPLAPATCVRASTQAAYDATAAASASPPVCRSAPRHAQRARRPLHAHAYARWQRAQNCPGKIVPRSRRRRIIPCVRFGICHHPPALESRLARGRPSGARSGSRPRAGRLRARRPARARLAAPPR